MEIALERRIGRALEHGTWDGPLARLASKLWEHRASQTIARPLVLPSGVFTVGVGGATLGGSYRTPVAIELTRALSALAPVALVGHGHRASVRAATVVQGDEPVQRVGDEALVAARAVAGTGAQVIVGPSRQAALAFALASGARAVVFDGMLQSAPIRVSAAVLTLDADAPWGAGRLPPAGDLRAPAAALRAHADHEITIDARSVQLMGLRPLSGDARLPLGVLANVRFGLATSIARPNRVVRTLAAYGLAPVITAEAPDHGRVRFPATHAVDTWLITEKCAVNLPRTSSETSHLPRQVFVLESRVQIPDLSRCLMGALRAHLDRPEVAP